MSRRNSTVSFVFLGDSADAERAMRRLQDAADQTGNKAEQLGKKWGAAGQTLQRRTAPIALAFAGAAKAFGDFDAAMVQSTAIMGDISGPVRQRMEDAAKSVAETTRFSATEAAESYFFLASAGLDATSSIEALPAVAGFAQAGMFDMARATDLLTDAQSALGLASDDAQTNLANMERVSDVLVKANTLANASVEQFSESLTNKAAAGLRTMNKDVEEGVAVLAALADQGTKGAEAGETLNIVLRDVTRAAAANRDAFSDLGIEVFDADGNMRNLADVVADMEGAFGELDDATLATTLEQLGLTRAVGNNIRQLLGTSDAIREYEGELRNAAGTTDDIANKQMESLNAQLGLARDRLVTAAMAIGETVLPLFVRLSEIIATAAETFADLPGPVRNTAIGLGLAAVAAGPLLRVAGGLATTWGKLSSVFATSATSIGFASRGMDRALLGFTNLVGAINPLTIGLTAAAGAAYLMYRRASQAAEATDSAAEAAPKLAESMGLAWEIAQRRAEEAGDAAVTTEQEFARANANAIDRLRELEAEAADAFLIQVGYQLTQQGATPEEAFGAIQQLADAAGVEIPVGLEPPDLADFEGYLDSIRTTVESTVEEITSSIRGMTVETREDFRGIGQQAAEAFQAGDVEGFIRILGEAEQAVADSALSFGAQRSALELINTEALRYTEVQGLSLRQTEDLATAIDQLVENGQGLAASERDVLQAFLDTLRATGDYEQAMLAASEAADAAAEASGDLGDAASDAGDQAGDATDDVDGLAGAQDDLEDATDRATHALKAQADEIRAQQDPMFNLIRTLDDVETAQDNLNTVMADSEATQRDVERAALDLASKTIDLQAAVGEASGAFGGQLDPAFRETMRQAGMTTAEIQLVEEAFRRAANEAGTYEGTYHATATADVSQALRAFGDLQRAANRTRTPSQNVFIGRTALASTVGLMHDGGVVGWSSPGRLPGLRHDERMTTLQVGEEILTADDPRHRRNLVRGSDGASADAGMSEERLATAIVTAMRQAGMGGTEIHLHNPVGTSAGQMTADALRVSQVMRY